MPASLTDAICRLRAGLRSGELSLSVLDAGGGVMLSVQSEQMISLNPSAITILEGISAGTEHVDDLAAQLQQRFDVDAALALKDCTEFVLGLDTALQTPSNPSPN